MGFGFSSLVKRGGGVGGIGEKGRGVGDPELGCGFSRGERHEWLGLRVVDGHICAIHQGDGVGVP